MPDAPKSAGEIILYQTEDGRTRIECRFAEETVWLTQGLLAGLDQVGVNTINHHIKTIYAEGELLPEATIRRHRIVQTKGGRAVDTGPLRRAPAPRLGAGREDLRARS